MVGRFSGSKVLDWHEELWVKLGICLFTARLRLDHVLVVLGQNGCLQLIDPVADRVLLAEVEQSESQVPQAFWWFTWAKAQIKATRSMKSSTARQNRAYIKPTGPLKYTSIPPSEPERVWTSQKDTVHSDSQTWKFQADLDCTIASLQPQKGQPMLSWPNLWGSLTVVSNNPPETAKDDDSDGAGVVTYKGNVTGEPRTLGALGHHHGWQPQLCIWRMLQAEFPSQRSPRYPCLRSRLANNPPARGRWIWARELVLWQRHLLNKSPWLKS